MAYDSLVFTRYVRCLGYHNNMAKFQYRLIVFQWRRFTGALSEIHCECMSSRAFAHTHTHTHARARARASILIKENPITASDRHAAWWICSDGHKEQQRVVKCRNFQEGALGRVFLNCCYYISCGIEHGPLTSQATIYSSWPAE